MTDGQPSLTEQNNKRYRSFYHKNKQYVKEKNIAWANDNFENYTYNRVRQRAKREGTEFTITAEDIIIPENCPFLGTPLIKKLGEKLPTENVISLDRIDSSKGYIKGNIQVLSHKANRMKNDATHEELLTFCTNYLNLTKNRTDLDDRWKKNEQSKTNLDNPERRRAGCVYGSCEQSCQPGESCHGLTTYRVPR